VDALTAEGVTAVEIVKSIATAGLKITPDIQVSGSTGQGENGLVQVLLADLVKRSNTNSSKTV
jgi:hypothetical protein